ncbi:MAG: hypothetical protein ACI9EF_003529 [Pseudohongiellaceae bacterium]|jgi:hypothetical protein
MNIENMSRRLAMIALSATVFAGSAQAQLMSARLDSVEFDKPPAITFGDSLLTDPVDVAVMSWCNTPITWAFVADAGANTIVRFVIKPDGSAILPAAWSSWLEGPWGVAVNDLPDHNQQEVVYASGTDLSGNRVVKTFDKWGNGYPGNYFVGAPGDNFVDPRGIAIGPNGNVFVADMARRVVEEFGAGDVYTYNSSTPVNTYGLFSPMVPFDVSVDLMRRVHIAGNEYFPFADGRTDVYQYGDLAPTTTLGGTNRIQGIDAKGLFATRYSWATSAIAKLYTLDWTDTVWPAFFFASPATKNVPTSGSVPVNLGGLELQRTWRVIGLDGLDRIMRCDGRTYLADRADGEVQVLSTKRDSVARPIDAAAWWKFDEGKGGTAKETLSNRHGVWSATGARATEGVVRCALSFDGGTFGVEVPNHATLEVGSSDFTIEGWMRSEFQSGFQTFIDKRSVSGLGYRAFLMNGALSFEIDDGATSHTTTATALVNDGLWHHVAMVVTRGVGTRLFVDGALVGTGASGSVTGSLSSADTLHFGRSKPGSTDGLLGGLDEITLYHQAVSAAEISAIAKAECGGKHLPPLPLGSSPLSASVSVNL